MFSIFTFVHIYANYKAVKALKISTLNSARLNIVISSYLETGSALSPDIVNKKEAVVLGQGLSGKLTEKGLLLMFQWKENLTLMLPTAAKNLCGHDITIGESIAAFIRDTALTADQFKVLHHLHQDRGYLLVPSKKHRKIHILLQQGVSAYSTEIVQAYFHAVLLGIATNMTNELGSEVMFSII